MTKNLRTLQGRGKYGAPGRWNDPDFLECGNGEFACDEHEGCTAAQLAKNRAHFALWSITSAPLIAGNDLRHMSGDILKLLTDKDAIAINQAYAGNAGDLLSEFNSTAITAVSATAAAVAEEERPRAITEIKRDDADGGGGSQKPRAEDEERDEGFTL